MSRPTDSFRSTNDDYIKFIDFAYNRSSGSSAAITSADTSVADRRSLDSWETIAEDGRSEYRAAYKRTSGSTIANTSAADDDSLNSWETVTQDDRSEYSTDEQATPRNANYFQQQVEAGGEILRLLGVSGAIDGFFIEMNRANSGSHFKLKVNDDMSVLELAKMVEKCEGMPLRTIVLLRDKICRIFDGDVEGEMGKNTMGELDVKEGDRIYIVDQKQVMVIPRDGWYTDANGRLRPKKGEWLQEELKKRLRYSEGVKSEEADDEEWI